MPRYSRLTRLGSTALRAPKALPLRERTDLRVLQGRTEALAVATSASPLLMEWVCERTNFVTTTRSRERWQCSIPGEDLTETQSTPCLRHKSKNHRAGVQAVYTRKHDRSEELTVKRAHDGGKRKTCIGRSAITFVMIHTIR